MPGNILEILGKHVRQQGSLVAPERLRFDFTHVKKLTQKEIVEVQNLVNEKIRLNLPVHKHITSYNEAIESGALAFFGDKYDTYSIKDKIWNKYRPNGCWKYGNRRKNGLHHDGICSKFSR